MRYFIVLTHIQQLLLIGFPLDFLEIQLDFLDSKVLGLRLRQQECPSRKKMGNAMCGAFLVC